LGDSTSISHRPEELYGESFVKILP